MWLIRHQLLVHHERVRRVWAVSLCCLLVAAGLVGATTTAGATVDGATTPALASDDDPALPASTTPDAPANNSTVQHEDPAAVDENGDVGQLKSWLTSRLADRFSQSTLQLSQGEYEQARGVLGDDYRDLLGKYVDVAGDTTGDGDDQTANRLQDASTTQREYVDEVRSFRETYDEYQAAKANGNEARARRLARNLSATGDRVQQLSQNLTADLLAVQNTTDVQFGETIATTRNITETITSREQSVTAAEFVATRLEVSATESTVSFSNPLTITGQVSSENGSAVAGESATVVVGSQRARVTLDADGRFTVSFRPVTTPERADTVSVRFRPVDTSRYLGSNGTVPVDIRQATPTVTVETNTKTVGYGDRVQVFGQTAVAGTPVPDAPVTVRLGDGAVQSTRTNTDGEFDETVRVGARMQPGQHEVVAVAGDPQQAVGSGTGASTIRVVETSTSLSVTGTVEDERLVLQGRLTTTEGRPIPGQPVELSVSGLGVTTATTNQTGAFQTSMATPGLEPESQATVDATYTGTGTNLDESNASTSVTIPAAGSGPGPGAQVPVPGTNPTLLVGAGLLALLLAGVLAVGWRRRRSGTGSTTADGATAGGSGAGDSTGAAVPPVVDRLHRAMDAATTRLESGGPGAAVDVLYPAVRQYLTTTTGLAETGTHWEFYDAVRETPATADWAPVVRDLSESYERRRYAERSVDPADVAVILDQLGDRLAELDSGVTDGGVADSDGGVAESRDGITGSQVDDGSTDHDN